MSADRVDRKRAVTTRRTKRHPTKGKSVRERLRKIWQVGLERVEMSADRVDRTRAVTTRPTKRDPTKGKSVRERLRKKWQLGFREDRNVGGPSRLVTGRHDRSSKTRSDKPEVSSRETSKYVAGGFQRG